MSIPSHPAEPEAAVHDGTDLDLRRLGVLAGWALLALTFAANAVGIVRASDAWLVHQVPDDVFYYLVIGDNLASGAGATFDGINETNGFHPAWQGVSTVVAAVVPHGTEQLRALLLVALALTAAATLGAIRLFGRVVGLPLALVGALLALHDGSSLQTLVNGMESALVTAALVAVASACGWCLAAPGTRRGLALGVVCGVAVLCRLDLVVVLPVVAGAVWWRTRSLPTLGALAGGVALIGVPTLTWWYASFGHLLSVSGTVKDHWVDQAAAVHGGRLSAGWVGYLSERGADYGGRLWTLATDAPGIGGTWLGTVLVGGLAAIGAWHGARIVAARDRHARVTDDEVALLVLVAMLVLKAATDLLGAPIWAVGWWYDAPQNLVAPMVVGVAAGAGVWVLWRRWRAVGVAVGAVGALFLLPGTVGVAATSADEGFVDGDWRVAHWQAGEWIRDEGPTARYGAFDAGAVGFLVEAPSELVNLDGLVNDYDYAELVARDAPLEERLAHDDVQVLVRWLPDDRGDDVLPCAPRLWRSSGAPIGTVDGAPAPGHVWVLDVRPCALG